MRRLAAVVAMVATLLVWHGEHQSVEYRPGTCVVSADGTLSCESEII